MEGLNLMIRTIAIMLTWADDHIDTIKFIYAPEHNKDISADQFKAELGTLVGTNISAWTEAQKSLIDEPVTDVNYIASHGGDAVLTEVREE